MKKAASEAHRQIAQDQFFCCVPTSEWITQIILVNGGREDAYKRIYWKHLGFPGGSDGKESACNVGDWSLIPGLEKSPGEENGNPFQCSCLENSMDRGAWRATVHGVAKSRTCN